MPIECSIEPASVSRDEYHKLDYKVMAIIFDVHKELGRLYNEKIYQNQIFNRCREAGFNPAKEVSVRIYHEDFEKVYFIDLIINMSILYEFKAVECLNPQYRQQTLNYLFITGFKCGKLVNLGSQSVQSEFVTTSLNKEERYQFEIIKDDWSDLNSDSVWLRKLITDLLKDWGAFLDIRLFQEAVSYFRGGPKNFIRPVEIMGNNQVLGVQKLPLINNELAVRFTAIKGSANSYEKHLRRFLAHTPLHAMHWINFNKHKILMKTLIK